MKYREWIFLLFICGCGTLLANYIGHGVSFLKSLPGVLILSGITLLAVWLSKTLPIKLPIIAYCSILGLISATPLNPFHQIVIQSAGIIEFAAPFTVVGAFAGMAIADKLKTFVAHGWKYVLVGLAGFAGTFLGSLLWDTFTLKLTGVI